MMEQTAKEILTALIEGLARYGCGLAGICYEDAVEHEDKTPS